MIKIGSLCSTANVEPIKIIDKKEIKMPYDNVPVDEMWDTYRFLKTSGSATESGIIKYCYPYNDVPMDKYRDANQVIQKTEGGSTVKLEIPFDSKYKYQASVHKTPENIIVCLKGAPDRVVDMCGYINENGNPKTIEKRQKGNLSCKRILRVQRQTCPFIRLIRSASCIRRCFLQEIHQGRRKYQD